MREKQNEDADGPIDNKEDEVVDLISIKQNQNNLSIQVDLVY